MIKKVLKIFMAVAFVAVFLMLVSFAVDQNRSLPCNGILIKIDYRNGQHFINEDIVKARVLNATGQLEGKPISPGKLNQIEAVVAGIPSVQKTSVFRNIDGGLTINISQRHPILRVLNVHGQGYYIDHLGHLMPLSNEYTARVPVATGHINAGYSASINLSQERPENEISSNERRLKDLYRLALYIESEPFWRAFIDHIYVTANGQFELTPKNGAHVIEFGDLNQMESKFGKLMTFYQNGLSRFGWNEYRRINVKFSNQVICSK